MSKIIEIEKDSVLGRKMFGGYVYNLSCSVGGPESPSSLTIRIVSEDGNYSDPKISASSGGSESIKISSNLTFKGKLVSYTKNITPELSTLELKYIDNSFELDRWYVGLHNRHGINRKREDYDLYGSPSKAGQISKYLIIVGKEYHPCDTDFDSTVNGKEDQIKIDWCDPCPFAPPDKYGLSCSQDPNLDMQVYEVKYTFNELLDKISTTGVIKIKNRPDEEDFKKNPKEYAGSLRIVLQSWCSDFGFTFYWDFETNELIFLDLKSPIDLNLEEKYKDLSDYSETVSCEETNSRGVISYYEREGSKESYTCEDDRILTLYPLYASDIISDAKDSAGLIAVIKNAQDTVDEEYLESHEMSVALSYYSSALREIFWFYNHYKILDMEAAVESILPIPVEGALDEEEEKPYSIWTGGSLDSTITKKKEDKILKELGNMKILDVIGPAGSPDGVNTDGWSTILSQMGDERSKIIKEEGKKQGEASKYYFLVVENSLDDLTSKFDQDANIANNFMGKFWYRVYSPIIAGGDDNSPDISIQAPDASAEFLEAGSGVVGHPLAGFGHKPGSYLNQLLDEVKNDESKETSKFTVEEESGEVQKEYKIKKNLIVAERDAKWFPHSGDTEYYQDSVDYLTNNFGMWLVGQDGRPDALMRLSKFKDVAKNNKNIRIYCVREARDGKEFPVTKKEISNFYETKQMKKVTRTLLGKSRESDKPYEKRLITGASGLTGDKCRWVTFDGFNFMMPVGGSFFKEKEAVKKSLKDKMEEETKKFRELMAAPKKNLLDANPADNPDGDAKEFYKVRIKQSYNISVRIPKYQVAFVGDIPEVTMKHDFYFNELSQVEKELKKGACAADLKKIQEAHDKAYSYLKYSNSENKKTANFTLYGVFPKKYSIGEGLDSVSITIGDDGPKTTYTLSSKYKQIPESNFLNKIIEALTYRLAHKSIGGNLNSDYRPSSLPSN